MSEVKLYGDLPETTVVSVTIEALRRLYAEGFGDGNWDDCDAEPTIDAECGFYRFPAMAKLGEWTNEQQVEKLRSESLEACNALWDYDMGERFGKPNAPNRRTAYGMELMDVIHAAETALRMEFTDAEAVKLQLAVIVKNNKRGYYGGDASCC